MVQDALKAPFVYFGGKSRIADVVWSALGDVRHYVEPFFGSGAVLLSRQGYDPLRHVETINDADGFVANAWRSIKFSPEAVHRWSDWPVNHADKMARVRLLQRRRHDLLARLVENDEYHDPQLGGVWIWCQSVGIGKWYDSPNQIPHIAGTGQGVARISCREPGALQGWIDQLAARMRHVRVICGDWSRVCGGKAHDRMGPVGFFFDPPYAVEDRVACYVEEDFTVAHDVRRFCLAHGDKRTYRMVLAGYNEHRELLDHGWKAHHWKATGGYANTGKGRGRVNAARETLYLSPHCLPVPAPAKRPIRAPGRDRRDPRPQARARDHRCD